MVAGGDAPLRLRGIARDLIGIANKLGAPGTLFPGDEGPSLVAFAKRLLSERRLRERHFDKQLFGEPVWDLLLDLFIAYEECRDISMSSAAIAANVSATTALRYVAMMTDQGMIVRRADASDARRVYVSLSAESRARVAEYLASAIALRSS